MNDDMQEMLDHYQIRKTLSEYCHGCDRCDEPTMRSVYADESWDDHGHYRAAGPEFARIMAAAVAETTTTLSHLLGQSLITVSGDEAGAETYFFAVSTSTAEDGTPLCNQLGGRFVDQLHRQGNRWLIRHRTVVRDWGITTPVLADWTADAGLQEGGRSRLDPVYSILPLAHGEPHRTRTGSAASD